MTTIIGVTGYSGTEPRTSAVVLASDVATTHQNWEARGDVAVMQRTRKDSQKIYVNNAGDAAIAMSGFRDRAYLEFLYELINGKINLRESIDKGNFRELLELNLGRFGGRMFDGEAVNGLLIATRYDDKPMLWNCWPLGKIEERRIMAIGSGSDYALKHIGDKEILSPDQISIKEAVKYASDAVEVANTDIYTTGLDLVVVAPDKIHSFGNRIKSQIQSAKSASLNSIISEFN